MSVKQGATTLKKENEELKPGDPMVTVGERILDEESRKKSLNVAIEGGEEGESGDNGWGR